MGHRRSIFGQLLAGAAVAAIGALFGIGTLADAGAPKGIQTITGRVVGVADGDTLTVLTANNDQHRIRLQGIDAPERNQPFGQRSKQHLSDLAFGQVITVRWRKLDPYGRVVGQVLLPDGGDASLAQMKAGLAWFFRRYERELEPEERRIYAEAEGLARAQKLGLWSDPSSVPPWDFRKVQASW